MLRGAFRQNVMPHRPSLQKMVCLGAGKVKAGPASELPQHRQMRQLPQIRDNAFGIRYHPEQHFVLVFEIVERDAR